MRKAVFAVVLLFLVVSFIRNITDYQRNLSFYNQTRANFEKSRARNRDLKVKKQSGSSPFEVEKNLRNKQNLLRKDEVIVIIPSPSPLPTPYQSPTAPPQRQWIQLFFQ